MLALKKIAFSSNNFKFVPIYLQTKPYKQPQQTTIIMEDTSKLNTSKLGTKTYWDNFYDREITNFSQDKNDLGERWFDDSDAEYQMIELLMQIYMDSYDEIAFKNAETDTTNFIDLGTGNGHFLFELMQNEDFEADFTHKTKLLGCDYSAKSIELAKNIQKEKFGDNEAIQKDLTFEVIDLFDEKSDFFQKVKTTNNEKFQVVTDKGTLDAIALSGMSKFSESLDKELPLEHFYPYVIDNLLAKDGIFIITSCNFTQEELIKIIESTGNLKYYKHVNYPSIEFGGVKGSTICTVAFTTK